MPGLYNDDGNFLLNFDERAELIRKYPQAEKYIRQFLGMEEFIPNKKDIVCSSSIVRRMNFVTGG